MMKVTVWRRSSTPRGQSPTLSCSVAEEEAQKDERNYDEPG